MNTEEDAKGSQGADESAGHLEKLIPNDATTRKRVLASLLRALNSDNTRG